MASIVTGASAFPCYDHVPRTIVPPLTNGGMLRSMDNHQLADWLAKEAYASEQFGAKTKEDYLVLLGKPVSESSIAHGPEDASPQQKQSLTGHLDREQFEDMDIDALRILASEMGLDTGSLDTKEALLDVIVSEEVQVSAEVSGIHEVPTCKLVEELKTREGVETTVVAPGFTGSLRITGPAVVLNVTD